MKRVALAAMLLVACGRRDASKLDTSVTAATTPAAAAGPSACPATGMWAACQVVTRLDQSGLAPRVDPAGADEPLITPRGTLVHLGPSDLEVYIYIDVAAREKEEARLDKTKYVAFDAPITLKREATVIHSANLLAILHSTNEHQRERVSDAITAGPPQPAPRPEPRKP